MHIKLIQVYAHQSDSSLCTSTKWSFVLEELLVVWTDPVTCVGFVLEEPQVLKHGGWCVGNNK